MRHELAVVDQLLPKLSDIRRQAIRDFGTRHQCISPVLIAQECVVICTMENSVWATPDGKKPSLQELCFATAEQYDSALANAAVYDVTKMMNCFFKGLSQGRYSLPNAQPMASNAAE